MLNTAMGLAITGSKSQKTKNSDSHFTTAYSASFVLCVAICQESKNNEVILISPIISVTFILLPT